MQPRIKKGDTVVVLAGKDKGKKGKVLKVDPDKGKVIVEKINVVKRHQKATRNFQGGIIEKLAWINMSKIMLVCPHCGKSTRLGKNENGRVCKQCGETVDKVK